MVPFYRHSLGADADIAAVSEVLKGTFLTSAGLGRNVEAQICGFFGTKRAKLTNSWTNGAVATLLAMDIGPGDEVIVPAMTFIATSNVVEIVGATPVFVDAEPGTYLMDRAKVAEAITPKTKAVMPVHLYGQMVDIEALRDIVGADVAIIEDCAHCFEGTLNGHRPGAFSDAAIFSFYATKNITCGEGGAVISNDEDLMERLQQTVLHGMSAGADRRFEGQIYRHWDMARLGTKANLPDILASLLPRQIDEVDIQLAERKRLVARYRAAFQGHNLIEMVDEVPGGVSAEHLFVVGVPGAMRDLVLKKLNQAGVGATVNYRAVHGLEYYREKYGFTRETFPVAAEWGDRTFSLPLFPGLLDDEQDYVIETTLQVVAEAADETGQTQDNRE
ncbi:MAG: DegT/DnrJ/EryC1/StrS aminotransferase family protein [Boseongicola sp.]|nr:DegT/DnrJ/EryC1/StrS aminotransferase family protein [Boseongicola sp.]RZW07808.1 MAG: DegT/DnrJ/EryC1/StrS aminotransferase family protein [Paracoccaceae bacterium]